MTTEEINKLLNQINTINVSDGEKDEMRIKILQMAADSIKAETLKNLLTSPDKGQGIKKRGKNSKLGFKLTKKETENMSKPMKQIFACNDRLIPYRYHKGVYEAHLRRNGLDVFACAKTFEEMKKKFVQKLLGTDPEQIITERKEREKDTSPLFSTYIDEWLSIKRKTTKPSTYKEYERLCNYNLRASFGKIQIGKITRKLLQDYLFRIVEEGKHRTAEKLLQILTCIFDLVSEDLNIPSPVKKIVLPYYETKKGNALTKEEEKTLVDFCVTNAERPACSALLVLLYFGLRKSELASIEVNDGVLTCATSKTKFGREEVKRSIPFTPVFKRVLHCVDFEKAKNANVNTLDTTFKRLFPTHHVHELRYTFITRCKESSVPGEVVMLWDGHSFDKDVATSAIDRGYTDYSKEFILSQAEKVDYAL